MGDRISPFIFFHWHCFVLPGYDLVFIPLFRYSVLSWHNSVTFNHAWGLHILLTNIVWKSYRWRWGHCSINTIIHWIDCTILLDGGHQRYSTNYYINRNTKRKGWTWWFTYILKKRKKEKNSRDKLYTWRFLSLDINLLIWIFGTFKAVGQNLHSIRINP